MRKPLFFLSILVLAIFVVGCAPGVQLPRQPGFESSFFGGQATKVTFTPVDFCSKNNAIDEFVKGTLQFTKKGKSYSYDDKCWKNGVIEYSCNEGKNIGRALVECANGCVEGACVKSSGGTDDLSSYPTMFLSEGPEKCLGAAKGTFCGYIVVGMIAPATDNLAVNNLINFGKLPKVSSGLFKLDAELSTPYTLDSISVGTPCVNTVTANLLGADVSTSCVGGNYGTLTEKVGRIKLIKASGLYHLLVYGHDAESVRVAAEVLTFRAKELTGNEVEVTWNEAEFTTKTWETATITTIS